MRIFCAYPPQVIATSFPSTWSLCPGATPTHWSTSSALLLETRLESAIGGSQYPWQSLRCCRGCVALADVALCAWRSTYDLSVRSGFRLIIICFSGISNLNDAVTMFLEWLSRLFSYMVLRPFLPWLMKQKPQSQGPHVDEDTSLQHSQYSCLGKCCEGHFSAKSEEGVRYSTHHSLGISTQGHFAL